MNRRIPRRERGARQRRNEGTKGTREDATRAARVAKPDVAGNNLLHPTTCCTPLKILHASPSNFTVNCLFGRKKISLSLSWRISLARGRCTGAGNWSRESLWDCDQEGPKRNADRRTSRQQIERFYYDAGFTRPPRYYPFTTANAVSFNVADSSSWRFSLSLSLCLSLSLRLED